jgi:hypothetical protein
MATASATSTAATTTFADWSMSVKETTLSTASRTRTAQPDWPASWEAMAASASCRANRRPVRGRAYAMPLGTGRCQDVDCS